MVPRRTSVSRLMVWRANDSVRMTVSVRDRWNAILDVERGLVAFRNTQWPRTLRILAVRIGNQREVFWLCIPVLKAAAPLEAAQVSVSIFGTCG